MLSNIYEHFIRPRLVFALAATRARLQGKMVFRVLASNMAATLAEGEAGLVEPIRKSGEAVTHGQVIAYRSDKHQGTVIPSRVVALGGQSVELRDGKLLVDDVHISEPYLDPRRAEQDYSRNVSRQVVPEGAVYLLGDFRDMSEDSRAIGAVPLRCVVGQVIQTIPLKRSADSRSVR